MPTQNQDLKYRLLGEDVSAGRTFAKVGQEAKSAHGAINALGQSLQSTGAFTPMMQALDAVSVGLAHVKENGRSTRVVMEGVGIGVAAAGAALLGLGASAQQAHAGLEQAITATGNAYGSFAKQVDETVAKAATFGRTAGDTENALARLTTATQDPQKALGLMSLTANIAAARNMNLTDSAQLLTTALAGNTRVFRQFGINVGTGKLSVDQLYQALDELNRRLSGRAQAQADTFSGRIKAMGVEFENAAEQATKFAPLLIAVGTTVTAATAAWDLLAKAKERNVAADVANIASSRRVAAAELEAAAAGLPDLRSAAGLAGAEGAGSRFALSGAGFARAGGLAVGGFLTGQVASAAVGGHTGSVLGSALTGAGTGAALGSFIGPEGTIIGGALGAVGGELFGLFHHSSKPKFSPMQQQAAAQQAADQASTDAWMWAEFDPRGNPKAQKLADATENLTKARTRLARAQDDLNKMQARSADPVAVAAATERLTAAEANLRKAQYVGGTARIASAQAAVDQAQAHLNALHAGTDTTGAARRVADAHQAVTDAQQRASRARLAAGGVTASQFLTSLTGQATDKATAAKDLRILNQRFHLVDPVLQQIVKQGDATVEAMAETMTKGLAVKINQRYADLQAAGRAFGQAGKNAFKSPAEAIGKQSADWMMGAFARRFVAFDFTGPLASNVDRLPPGWHPPMALPTRFSGQQGLPPGWHPPMAVPGSVVVQHAHVNAQSPQQMSQQLLDLARHKGLGVPTNAGQ